MCRILAQFSIQPTHGQTPLIDDPYSLFKQSNAKLARLQQDGWGITWYQHNRPNSVHSVSPFFQEQARVKQIAKEMRSNIFIAHIRAASNPLALPREKIVRLENTQPFVRPPWTFAHNGTLYPVSPLRAELGGAIAPLQGNNDSELLFALLLRQYQRSYTSMVCAIRAVVKQLKRFATHPFSSLNFVASDGTKLYAFCLWDPKRTDDERRSLCLGTQHFFQMSYHVSPTKVLVASEPTHSGPAWQVLPNGTLLTVEAKEEKLQCCVQTVPA
jgi:predicted glutamine amidotransferase